MKRTLPIGITAAVVTLGALSLAPRADARPKAKRVEAGQPAPAFRIRTRDGAMVRLENLAYPGKERSYDPKRPVLLDFFRTDCEPCLKAMPELVALSKAKREAGLHVLLVALLEETDGDAKLDRYLADHKLPFPVVVDRTEHVAELYMGNVVSLPATYLIDREGVVLKTKHDAKGSLAEYFGPTLEKALAAHAEAKKKP